jgi:hypothetical protein
MKISDVLLLEAVADKEEKEQNVNDIIKEIKQALNICKLAKFKSESSNSKFYTGFFNSSFEETLTFSAWNQVYITLLNEDTFCNNLCMFIAMWRPKDFKGMFQPIINEVDSELRTTQNKVRLLSDAKALFSFMEQRFDSIANTVKAQVNDQDTMIFLTTIKSVTTNFMMYFNKLLQDEIREKSNPDDIVITVRGGPMEENVFKFEPDVQEFFDLLEHADEWKANYIKDTLNEGIINKGKEAIKVAKVKSLKADRAFNDFVMSKVREIRRNRRNRRHAEIVGESLRINAYLKRILKALGLGVINPAIGVISFIVDTLIDEKTKVKDRKILIQQIQDELEIIDEKISIADRNGDEKGKIELMRGKQKLQREYQRITNFRYDPDKHR